MTKEMTPKEIAAINSEFKTANAFTKWKFMQTPEFNKLPDAVRYTVEKECLTHYFTQLHSADCHYLYRHCRFSKSHWTGC